MEQKQYASYGKKLCQYCRTEIDKKTKICPVCRKRQHNKYAWIAVGGVAFMLLCSMCSSGGDNSSNTNNSATDTSTQTAQEQTQSSAVEVTSPPTSVPTPEPSISTMTEEEEFKLTCEYLSYEDILRNSSNYKMVKCKVTGEVDQIIEGWFGNYTIFITDSDGNKWGCTYTYKDGESKLLEGDSVTVYGYCNETQNTETVLGKQVTLPYVSLEYIR